IGSLLAKGCRELRDGDYDHATETYSIAVMLESRSAEAHCGLGKALIAAGNRTDGFESLVTAFQLDSLLPEVKDGFREYYRKEIEADPSSVDAYEGLAALCIDSGRPEEAASCYSRCLELTISEEAGRNGENGGELTDRRDRWEVALFKCRAALCDWKEWDASTEALRVAVRRGGIEGGKEKGKEPPKPPVLHPFDSLSASLSPEECLTVARQQSRWVEAATVKMEDGSVFVEVAEIEQDGHWDQSSRTGGGQRLRLGYMSGDLMGTHPLTHLMQARLGTQECDFDGTFGSHDRSRFEVYLYSLNAADGSKERHRMEKDVEHFRDLSAMTSQEAARTISEDCVDVLVNLNGYAGTSRSADVLVWHPASILVSYMGFPGTMGSSRLSNYILADGIVIPESLREHYSEKVM
ncbi:unnamed protein product, partial [Choristocarpus tenellus]